jgi:hypothetical protein
MCNSWKRTFTLVPLAPLTVFSSLGIFFLNFWKNSTTWLNVGDVHCPLIEAPTLAFPLAEFPFEAMELHLNNNALK